MQIQLLSAFGSILGGLFSGLLLGVLFLFIFAWFVGSHKDKTRLAIQAVVVIAIFLPAVIYLFVFILSDWLLAVSASISFGWMVISVLQDNKKKALPPK